MKKFISQILVILLLTISILAQTEEQKPELIDEYERISLEDELARLEGLIYRLSKDSNTKAFIRIYSGNENCFLCHHQHGSLISAILTHTLNIPSDKYSIEFCVDNKDEMRTQLFLVPTTVILPKCKKNLEIPKKSARFDEVHDFFDDNKLSPLEDSGIDVIDSPHGKYSRYALQAVKEILGKSAGSKIYIIVYLGTNPEEEYEDENGKLIEKKRSSDKKSLAKKMLLNAKKEVIKNGIKPSQIETLEAGYVDDKRRLEFWFVPKGGEIPKPKPNYFPKKSRSKK